MGFTNVIMLAAMAAVAIPIVVHLLNRRRARVTDWGAMQFLLGSIAARNRRIMLEEILLMALRCLLVALLVLAVARPFVPKGARIPWAVVLPAFVGGVLCLAVAGAAWTHRRLRWGLLAAGAALLLIGGGATAAEQLFQRSIWPQDAAGKDVAIVIDGSDSMRLKAEGVRNFDLALDEARQVIAACRPEDTVSVLIAGPVPREATSGQTSDFEAVGDVLRELRPVGGSFDSARALQAGAAALRSGHNRTKRIVLITDAQAVGWASDDAVRWRSQSRSLAGASGGHSVQVVCRALELPRSVANAAIEEIRFSRRIVGPDRPVKITAVVRNAGSGDVEGGTLELDIEGLNEPLVQSMENLAEGSTWQGTFEHRFDRPGAHVVSARLRLDDDLASDNRALRVVDVIDRLPVLIVEGAPSARPADSGAAFTAVALSLRRPGAKPNGKNRSIESVVDARVVTTSNLSKANLDDYRAVVLANVARLPDEEAERLAAYVQAGGGLLILPGHLAAPAFYNNWRTATGEPVAPAAMSNERKASVDPMALSLASFTHAPLRRMIDSGDSDAGSAGVRSYWPLFAPEARPLGVRAALDNGDPLLVERSAGEGRVLMAALAFDGHDSNIPRVKTFFVPLVHELVMHLAAPAARSFNVPAGTEVPIPAGTLSADAAEQLRFVRSGGDGADGGSAQPFSLVVQRDPKTGALRRLAFNRTEQPGLYRLRAPATVGQEAAGVEGTPLVVLSDPAESAPVALSEADFERLRRWFDSEGVRLDFAVRTEEMTSIVAGEVPGREIWKYLAVAALIALVAEVGLARWIASQRKLHSTETVHFGDDAASALSFKARARRLVDIPNEASAREGGS